MQKFGLWLAVLLVGMFACIMGRAEASVSLQWYPVDDPSVVGYNVYVGEASRCYTNFISTANVTNAMVDGLIEGKTYYFAVTACDVFGGESDYSDETSYIVPGFLLLTPGTSQGDPMRIHFPVVPGHWFELQASKDLGSWMTIWQTIGVSNMWVEYGITSLGLGSQFYRVVIH